MVKVPESGGVEISVVHEGPNDAYRGDPFVEYATQVDGSNVSCYLACEIGQRFAIRMDRESTHFNVEFLIYINEDSDTADTVALCTGDSSCVTYGAVVSRTFGKRFRFWVVSGDDEDDDDFEYGTPSDQKDLYDLGRIRVVLDYVKMDLAKDEPIHASEVKLEESLASVPEKRTRFAVDLNGKFPVETSSMYWDTTRLDVPSHEINFYFATHAQLKARGVIGRPAASISSASPPRQSPSIAKARAKQQDALKKALMSRKGTPSKRGRRNVAHVG